MSTYKVCISYEDIMQYYPELSPEEAARIITYHKQSMIEGALQNIDGIVKEIVDKR